MRALCAATIAGVLAGTVAGAGAVDFRVEPKAVRSGEQVTVTFAVSAATDAEVAVLDAGGKVVRRLGAAALGAKKAPPSPFQAGLSQSIVWDGKDDLGRPVAGVAVRVRLGLRIGPAREVRTGFKLPSRIKPRNAPAKPIDAKRMFETLSEDYSGNWSLRPSGDPDTGAIYYRRNDWSKWTRDDPAGGRPAAVGGLKYVTGDIAFGTDGLIYPIHWGWITRRLDRAWKPAPPAPGGSHGIRAPPRNSPALDAEGFGDSLGPDTPCLGLDGKLYRFASHPKTGYARVHVWGRDGKLEKTGVFPFARIRHGSVIRVDREGRLYVALNGLPEETKASEKLPEHYRPFLGTLVKLRLKGRWAKAGARPDPDAGKLPADAAKRASGLVLDTWTTTWSGNPRWGYVYSGQRGKPTIKPAKAFVHGVEWAAPGISWISPPGNCVCNGPWFDLDRFGRLFVPDPARSRVRILDGRGNPIAELAGKSGELFIARPIRVAAAGDRLGFWDAGNLRVLSAKIEYAASRTVEF